MVVLGKGKRGWHDYATARKPEWKDIAALSKKKSSEQAGVRIRVLKLLELPEEILDLVLGEESLTLRDHLSLAATCCSLRACYYTPCEENPNASSNSRHSPLWSGLIKIRPETRRGCRKFSTPEPDEAFAVEHIWTNAQIEPYPDLPAENDDEEEFVYDDPDDSDYVYEEEDGEEGEGIVEGDGTMQVLRIIPKDWGLTKDGKPRKKKRRVSRDGEGFDEKDLAIRSREWNMAIEFVNYFRLSKTEARTIYKLKNDELVEYLYAYCKNNPYARRAGYPTGAGHPMNLFLEASVESLAFRLHGGAGPHEQLIKKRAATAAKAKATRARNIANGGAERKRNLGDDSSNGYVSD